MHNVRKVADDIWWLGASDRRIELFENTHRVPEGMSYNNYLVLDEKTCLLDGVDEAVTTQFWENLDFALGGRDLDYMVVDHMEPDHCAVIPDLVRRYPQLRLVGTAQAFKLMGQFFDFDAESRAIKVKEGDTLDLGRHTLQFVCAPMVHWPEVMVAYDQLTGTLFSADAFGAFGAMSGCIFADEVEGERDWADEARRYYANIVGKYGMQTTALLKKASKLDVRLICPLHAHLWRRDFDQILGRYAKWASYEPELRSVAIFYGSVYGHTANAADILSRQLAELGVRDVRVYDSSKTDVSELISRAFQYSHLVFASSTYNMEIFDGMRDLLLDLGNHGFSKRTVGVIYNGSWAPAAGKLMLAQLEAAKDVEVLEPVVHLVSSVKEETVGELDALAHALAASVRGE